MPPFLRAVGPSIVLALHRVALGHHRGIEGARRVDHVDHAVAHRAGCSIMPIASGPPRTWMVNTPLPASFAFLTYSRKLRE